MKVKDIKIEDGEFVVLTEVRKPLNEFSYEYVYDIINNKDKIINGYLDDKYKIFRMTDFKVLKNGCWSFQQDIVEFIKDKND